MKLLHLFIFFMFFVSVFLENVADSKFPSQDFYHRFLDTKADLARSLFKKELSETSNQEVVNLTHTNVEELVVPGGSGATVRIFRSADENFFYNGDQLLQLQKNDSTLNRYSLQAVHDVRIDEGAVFFKNMEWKNKIFLVICYQKGYCEVRISAQFSKENLKLKINTEKLPLDVTFFGTQEDLFLIMVLDPVVIYRWTGTYFDEVHRLDTTGAQSVAIFQDEDKFIVVVAQNLGVSKVFSKVYLMKNDKIELFQLLPTKEALRVLPFSLFHGEEKLNFVFVLNSKNFSQIFWWTNKEFVPWTILEKVFGQRIIYIEKIGSKTFFFISDKNKVYVYHPSITSFDLLQIILFDRDVVGIDLRQEKDQLPMLILLTGSAMDPYIKINLIFLKVVYNFLEVTEVKKNPEELVECLKILNDELKSRHEKLNKLSNSLGEIEVEKTDGLLNEQVSDMVMPSLENSVEEVMNKVQNIEKRWTVIKKQIEERNKGKRYYVEEDLVIDKMNAKVINATILNGKSINFKNFLSLTENQTFSGEMHLDILSTDLLDVPSIDGIVIEDLLLRNKEVQKIYGDFHFSSMSAKNIKFGPKGTLNGIPFVDIITNKSSSRPITGTKTFTMLKANQVEVDKINKIPAEEWLAKILPKASEAFEEKPLSFTDLTVDNLWVFNLNGIPWNDFLNDTYLLDKEPIESNLTIMGKAVVENLVAKKINEIIVTNVGRQSNFTCESAKVVKSRLFDIDSNIDDSIKEILNEFESQYENDILYFSNKTKLEGPIYTSQIFVKNPVKLSGTLINLENITERFWMANQDQIIEVPVSFIKNITVTNTLTVDTLSGNTLDSFVRIDTPNSDLPQLVFEDAEIEGNVTFKEDVVHNVNLKNLNSEVVGTILNDIVLGREQYLKKLSTKNLTVNILNEIQLKDFSDIAKAALRKSENLFVPELVINGNLTVEKGVELEKLNNYDFNKTVSSMLTLDDPDFLKKAIYNSLTVENLEVDTINGINLEEKLPRLSRLSQNDIFLVIEGNLKVLQLNVNSINAIKFDDFINQVFLKNKSNTIKGRKIFKETVTVIGNFQGNLNNYNLTELEANALSKTKPQTITALYTVESYRANDVDVEFINGVPSDDIIFQDVSNLQIINSDVVFNNIAIAGNILAENFMNDCHLKELIDVDIRDLQNFNTLDVWGDVSWRSTGKSGPLGNLLDNVVTTDKNQVITGSVVFENDVLITEINGSKYIDDVNLGFIEKDAIFKTQQNKGVLPPVTFKGHVTAHSIEIKGSVLVNTINNVDITDIDQKLVRKTVNTFITGKKTFKNGFVANRFDADSVNDDKIDQIMFYNKLENVNTNLNVTFKNLNIFDDLTVKSVNGHDLNNIIETRLSKTKNQNINGKVTIEGNVFIKDDVEVNQINDVNINETILASEESAPQIINGRIIFNETILINGNIEANKVNDNNISVLYEKAILIDEDVEIEADIEFLDGATIDGNLQINDSINSCEINKAISMDLSDDIEKEINHHFRETLRNEVNLLTNISFTLPKPLIFLYLEEAMTIDLQLPSMHASVVSFYNDTTEINIYGMNYGECGLPSDCYCPTQVNLFFKSMVFQTMNKPDNKTRFFKYYDSELEIDLMVITTSVSYSMRCMKHEEEVDQEHTSITWIDLQTSETYYQVNLEKGFLSDVKFFKLGESIYIVMAFYFDPLNKQTNNLYTMVYELKNLNLTKIDQIPSSGVQVLEVFWTTVGYILVVGNSFDSDRFTDSVNSGIYRFNEYENKFELLRFVKTHGIMSVKGIRYKKTSFIFFVQKQSWPLLILKYNEEYDNYYFSQKLDTARSIVRSNFLSLSIISTSSANYSGDIYIGIVLSDDSFRLFKYKHIEGFVEETYLEQNNVKILQPFRMGDSQYLLAGSASDTSKVYKFIEQGRY